MPFKSDEDRRKYQRERYQRKSLARRKELDTLKELQRKLMFSSLSKDEGVIFQVLTEKYADELEKERAREKRITNPTEDQDTSMYDHIHQDERIIGGEGSEQTTTQTPRITVAQRSLSDALISTPSPTENTPKVRPSSWAVEWWINPKSGEWEEKPPKEDRGNIIDSPWKFKSIYEKK